ncbi:unnamed protein product [Debaryomyces tyrocola]|nr:unnamed protein product [Debaryomyces tyrocola]
MICSCCGKEKKSASQKKTCKKCRQKLKRRISKAKALDISNSSNWFGSSSPHLNENAAPPIDSNKPRNSKTYLKNEEFDSQQTIDVPNSQLIVEMSPQNYYGDHVYEKVSFEQNSDKQSNYEVNNQIQQDDLVRMNQIDLAEKTQEVLEDMEDDNNSIDDGYDNLETEFGNFQDDYGDASYLEFSQDSMENSIETEENLSDPSNSGANLPNIGVIEGLLERSDISIDNWAKVVNKKTGNIIDIHTTEKWLKFIFLTESIYTKASAKEKILEAIPESNYQIIRSGFIPRPINFAKLYDLQYCPECTRLKSIQNHFSHRIPSSLREKCTYRGPFKLVKGIA